MAAFAVCVCTAMLLAAEPASAQRADADTLLAALQSGGHVGLMRHAIAPGSDDPPNFRLRDCSTQRNLSDGGRRQAVEIGERLRAAGIDDARVVSSQWCRCLDTARLLDVGRVEELPALNSLVSYPGQGRRMTRDVAEWIRSQGLEGPVLLVTHQVNIGALLGTYPQEGEIVVAERGAGGDLVVVGTLRPE